MSDSNAKRVDLLAAFLLTVLALLVCGQALAANDGKIGSDQIINKVGNYLQTELQFASITRGSTKTEVRVGALDSRLRLADCGSQMQLSADLTQARSRVNVRVSCGGEAPWGMYVPANIAIYKPVVVAARNLSRGDRVIDKDVRIEDRDILSNGHLPLTSTEEAVGLLVTRSVAQGVEITDNMLERPVLVKRGDRVTLVSKAGSIAVSTVVEARENGREGERIRVKNLGSGRTVDATVTADGTVEIQG